MPLGLDGLSCEAVDLSMMTGSPTGGWLHSHVGSHVPGVQLPPVRMRLLIRTEPSWLTAELTFLVLVAGPRYSPSAPHINTRPLSDPSPQFPAQQPLNLRTENSHVRCLSEGSSGLTSSGRKVWRGLLSLEAGGVDPSSSLPAPGGPSSPWLVAASLRFCLSRLMTSFLPCVSLCALPSSYKDASHIGLSNYVCKDLTGEEQMGMAVGDPVGLTAPGLFSLPSGGSFGGGFSPGPCQTNAKPLPSTALSRGEAGPVSSPWKMAGGCPDRWPSAPCTAEEPRSGRWGWPTGWSWSRPPSSGRTRGGTS